MRKSVVFLRNWLGQMGIPGDEDGLISFVLDTIEPKQRHYQNLLEHEYTHDHYPEKEIVEAARDLMNDILSQSKDNVALLNRLIAKQDDLRDCTEDMEEVETFFNQKSQQRVIFDAARALQKDLQNERDYFATDTATYEKITEISSILAMPKPYARIKELPELMQSVRNAYGILLEQKKDEVHSLIIQCMGDVHTLAGVGGRARDEVIKSDERFANYKQKAADAISLTLLDAIITQLLNYKDSVLKWIETILSPYDRPQGTGSEVSRPKKVVQLRRYDVFPVKRLQSREDVDNYLESIKKKLYDTLENNDGIQIN
jgi:hypothetical protein